MENFISILNSINAWYWLGFAVILVILEVSLGVNFFLLWLGVSAATVGVLKLVYPPLIWEYQFLFFALESLVCIALWGVHLKRNQQVSNQSNLNRRNEQYLGRIVTLLEPVVNGRGRIHIEDSFWRIEGPDLPAGTAVKIIGVDGVVLKVEKV